MPVDSRTEASTSPASQREHHRWLQPSVAAVQEVLAEHQRRTPAFSRALGDGTDRCPLLLLRDREVFVADVQTELHEWAATFNLNCGMVNPL